MRALRRGSCNYARAHSTGIILRAAVPSRLDYRPFLRTLQFGDPSGRRLHALISCCSRFSGTGRVTHPGKSTRLNSTGAKPARIWWLTTATARCEHDHPSRRLSNWHHNRSFGYPAGRATHLGGVTQTGSRHRVSCDQRDCASEYVCGCRAHIRK